MLSVHRLREYTLLLLRSRTGLPKTKAQFPEPFTAQLALHRSSYGIQGHRSGHSSTLPLPEDGYVQIPMAVKEAACAKLSIPWRPNLGIQRVSNAKGSLAYKCFWHPQAPAIGIAEGI